MQMKDRLSKVDPERLGAPLTGKNPAGDQALRQLRKYVSEAQREIEQAREAEAGADDRRGDSN